jgi:hypothetical protein
MAGSQNRKSNNQLRDLARDLLETQHALAQTINVLDQLSSAHNVLQGLLLATGVISENAFKR